MEAQGDGAVMLTIRFLIAAAFLAAPAVGRTASVTFYLSGTTDPGSAVGAVPFTGSITYDTASYTNEILIGSVSAGSNTWSFAPQPSIISVLNSIYVYNNAGSPPFDAVTFYVGIVGPDVAYNASTWRPSYMVLAFGSEADVLQSSDIPSDPMVLNGFSTRTGSIQFEQLDDQGVGMGVYSGLALAQHMQVSTSPAPVPLPAAGWLLLSGLTGLGIAGRRRAAP